MMAVTLSSKGHTPWLFNWWLKNISPFVPNSHFEGLSRFPHLVNHLKTSVKCCLCSSGPLLVIKISSRLMVVSHEAKKKQSKSPKTKRATNYCVSSTRANIFVI